MKKRLSIYGTVLLTCFLTFGCSKKDVAQKSSPHDFESLMGKGLSGWQYVQTKEDWDNLNTFKAIFEKNRSLAPDTLKIPKTIHFIWIGPNNFPRDSVENVKSWISKNPDWEYKFWTDRERPLPHSCMKEVLVQDFTFSMLGALYNKTDNYAEKSDILRYEILYQEGGVYVDHDVKCLKTFDVLNSSYDLYCCLELPSKTSLSSVHATNNLIGSRAGHPVLKKSMEWLLEKWEIIEKLYPGNDRDSILDRVSHRSFSAFDECVKKHVNFENNRDIVFPAFYFNAPDDSSALFARHLYAGTWFENETRFEKMARQRLMKITKKTNKLFLFCGILGGINLVGFFILFTMIRKSKQKPLS